MRIFCDFLWYYLNKANPTTHQGAASDSFLWICACWVLLFAYSRDILFFLIFLKSKVFYCPHVEMFNQIWSKWTKYHIFLYIFLDLFVVFIPKLNVHFSLHIFITRSNYVTALLKIVIRRIMSLLFPPCYSHRVSTVI